MIQCPALTIRAALLRGLEFSVPVTMVTRKMQTKFANLLTDAYPIHRHAIQKPSAFQQVQPHLSAAVCPVLMEMVLCVRSLILVRRILEVVQ